MNLDQSSHPLAKSCQHRQHHHQQQQQRQYIYDYRYYANFQSTDFNLVTVVQAPANYRLAIVRIQCNHGDTI